MGAVVVTRAVRREPAFEGDVAEQEITFDTLFERNLEFVVRSLLRLGVPPRDVEDVAQQVFVVAHAKHASVSPTTSVRAWLWSILRRIASDYRALARHRIQLDGGELTGSHPDARNLAETLSTRELVHRALGMLPDHRREALILFEMEGLTLAEIAELSGVPIQTIASRIRKARTEFKAAVAELQGESA